MAYWETYLDELKRKNAGAQADVESLPLEARLPPIRDEGLALTDVNRFDVAQPAIDARREQRFAEAVQALPPIQRANVEGAQASMAPTAEDYGHEYGMWLHPVNVAQRALGGAMRGTARNLSSLTDYLPEDHPGRGMMNVINRNLYQKGQGLIDKVTVQNPALRGTIVGETIPSAASSVGEFMAAGAVNPLLAGALGATEQAGSEYAAARAAGASEEVAKSGTLIQNVIGSTDILTGMGGRGLRTAAEQTGKTIFGRTVGKAVTAVDKAAKVAENVAGNKLSTVVKVAVGPATEAIQEGILQQLPTNVQAQRTYDPTRGTWEGVGTAAAVGAGVRGAIDVTARGILGPREQQFARDAGTALAVEKGMAEATRTAEETIALNENQDESIGIQLTQEQLGEFAEKHAKNITDPKPIPDAPPGMEIDLSTVPGGPQFDVEGQQVIGRRVGPAGHAVIRGLPLGNREIGGETRPSPLITAPAPTLGGPNLPSRVLGRPIGPNVQVIGQAPEVGVPFDRAMVAPVSLERPVSPRGERPPFGAPSLTRRPLFMGRPIEPSVPPSVQGEMNVQNAPTVSPPEVQARQGEPETTAASEAASEEAVLVSRLKEIRDAEIQRYDTLHREDEDVPKGEDAPVVGTLTFILDSLDAANDIERVGRDSKSIFAGDKNTPDVLRRGAQTALNRPEIQELLAARSNVQVAPVESKVIGRPVAAPESEQATAPGQTETPQAVLAPQRSQLSAELDEGRAAAKAGLPITDNPYRKMIEQPNAPYRVDEIARNWESGWASVPESERGTIARPPSALNVKQRVRDKLNKQKGTSNAVQERQAAPPVQGVREQPVQDAGQMPVTQGDQGVQGAQQEGQVAPSVTETPDTVGGRLSSAAIESTKRIHGKMTSGGIFDPEMLKDFAVVGADYIVKGAKTVAEFGARLVKEFGESVRPHIDAIFKAAQDYHGSQPWYYSKLEDAVWSKMPNRASVAQIRAIVKDAPADELKWTGFDEWLSKKTALSTVSKQEVMDFLRTNAITVTEKELGGTGGSGSSTLANATDRKDRAVSAMHRRLQEINGGEEVSSDVTDVIIDFAQDDKQFGDLAEVAKEFPIGLTIIDDLRSEYDELRGAYREFYNARETDDEGQTPGATKFERFTLPGGENYRELLLQYQPAETATGKSTVGATPREQFDNLPRTGADLFRGSHFPEPNVLAHVRFNDRTDSDGKKTLFVEEVQSDWHEQGRDRGYREETPESLGVVKGDDGVYYVPGPYGNRQYAGSSPADVVENYLMHNNMDRGVPDAPFKKNWHELVMKRVLRYAAEKGYDKVAWTTGDQQADRYDLNQVATKIRLQSPEFHRAIGITESGVGYNKFMLTAIDKDGKEIDNWFIDREELPQYVGKEKAAKLLAKSDEDGTAELKGVDLKFGGEGMKGFYDKMIPDFMRAYTKKWGGQVGETTFDVSTAPRSFEEHQRGNTMTAHSVTITPSMKESVLAGQPLAGQGGPSIRKAGEVEAARKVLGRTVTPSTTATDAQVGQSGFFTEEKKQKAIKTLTDNTKLHSFLGIAAPSLEQTQAVAYLASHYVDQLLKRGMKAIMANFQKHLSDFKEWMRTAPGMDEPTFKRLSALRDRRGVGFFEDQFISEIIKQTETKHGKDQDRRDTLRQLRGFRFGKKFGASLAKARKHMKGLRGNLPVGFGDDLFKEGENPLANWKTADRATRLKMMSEANAKTDRATLPIDVRESLQSADTPSKFFDQFKTAYEMGAVADVLSDFRKSVKEFQATKGAEYKAEIDAGQEAVIADNKAALTKLGPMGRREQKKRNTQIPGTPAHPHPKGGTAALLESRGSLLGQMANMTRSEDSYLIKKVHEPLQEGEDKVLGDLNDYEMGEIALRERLGMSEPDVAALTKTKDIGLSVKEELSSFALMDLYRTLRQESVRKKLTPDEDADEDAAPKTVTFVRSVYASDKSHNFQIDEADAAKIKEFVEGHPYLKGMADLFDQYAKKIYEPANKTHIALTGNELGFHEHYHMLSRAHEQSNEQELPVLAKQQGWGPLEGMSPLQQRKYSRLPIKVFDNTFGRDYAYIRSMGDYAYKGVPGRRALAVLSRPDVRTELSATWSEQTYNRLMENLRASIGQIGPKGFQSLMDITKGINRIMGNLATARLGAPRPGPVLRQIFQGLPQLMIAVEVKHWGKLFQAIVNVAKDPITHINNLKNNPSGYVRFRRNSGGTHGIAESAANPHTQLATNKYTAAFGAIKEGALKPLQMGDNLVTAIAVETGRLIHGDAEKAGAYGHKIVSRTQNPITTIDTPEMLRTMRNTALSPAFFLAGSSAKFADSVMTAWKLGHKDRVMTGALLSVLGGGAVTATMLAALSSGWKDDEDALDYLLRLGTQTAGEEVGNFMLPGVGGDIGKSTVRTFQEGRPPLLDSNQALKVFNNVVASVSQVIKAPSSKKKEKLWWAAIDAAQLALEAFGGLPTYPIDLAQNFTKPKATVFGRRVN